MSSMERFTKWFRSARQRLRSGGATPSREMGVKIGDVVSGILFERGKVVGVGTGEELLMYDDSGALQEMLADFGDGAPVACVAVEFQDRRTAVYVASEVYPLLEVSR